MDKIDIKEGLIGLPYMGDDSDILAAALRAVGFNAEVIPSRTLESIEIAKKIVCTNTCRPFSFQIGDQIAWLEYNRKKFPDKKLSIFMAKARGPCRFGQYFVILKKIIKDRGFDDVIYITPSSEKDYSDVNLPKSEILKIIQLVFKGSISNSLLKSCLLRTRPYEVNNGESDKIYEKSHLELISLIEKEPGVDILRRFLKEKLKEFGNIKKDDSVRYPLVLISGEIFVRSHEKCNQDSIRLLESYKLEVLFEPVFAWMDYINKNTIRKSLETYNVSWFLFALLKRAYINNVSKRLSKAFDEYLKGRETIDSFKLIKDIEKSLIYHSSLEGESCISIGGAYAFIKDSFVIDGIFHVGPFGCMHETIATSRVQSLINKERANSDKLIPYMDAVFGDSPTPNLDSQVAIFAENCWLRKEMKEGKK